MIGYTKHTSAAVTISISRVTSSVANTSLFVTWSVVQTVTTTVVNTVVSIGPVITLKTYTNK